MRNISFALTTEQIRRREKTVTRRKGAWWAKVLRPGTLLCAVEKSQGIKKGELVRLCVIRVTGATVEPLSEVGVRFHDAMQTESAREGFPELDARGFVEMFCREMRCKPDQVVTRIAFEFVSQEIDSDSIGTCCTRYSCVYESEELHRNGLCRCPCHGERAFR